jgi:hypothetical protein
MTLRLGRREPVRIDLAQGKRQEAEGIDMRTLALLVLVAIVGLTKGGSAQMSDRTSVLASIDAKAAAYGEVALKILSFWEVGYE